MAILEIDAVYENPIDKNSTTKNVDDDFAKIPNSDVSILKMGVDTNKSIETAEKDMGGLPKGADPHKKITKHLVVSS